MKTNNIHIAGGQRCRKIHTPIGNKIQIVLVFDGMKFIQPGSRRPTLKISKRKTINVIKLFKKVIYKQQKQNGPKTDPCGTQLDTCPKLDVALSTLTNCC